MQAIRQFGTTVKRHPLATVGLVAVLAVVSAGLAAFFGLVAIACVLAPVLLEKHAPKVAVWDTVQAVRQHGLRVVQRAQLVKADEIGLQRMLNVELEAESKWSALATKALLKQDEAAALDCLAKKREHSEAAASLRVELEKQRKAVAATLPAVEEARKLATKAERTGNLILFRKRRAEARKAVAFEAAGLEEDADAFTRMRADVERAEDEADAAEEILGVTQAPTVAERIEREERDEALRADLEELKQQVGMKRPALNARAG